MLYPGYMPIGSAVFGEGMQLLVSEPFTLRPNNLPLTETGELSR